MISQRFDQNLRNGQLAGNGLNRIQLQPGMTMAEIERQAILGALRETGGNRRKSAELLGIGERTLYRKIRGYEEESGTGYASETGDIG